MRGGPTAPHAQSQSRSILTKDFFMNKLLILTIATLTLTAPTTQAGLGKSISQMHTRPLLGYAAVQQRISKAPCHSIIMHEQAIRKFVKNGANINGQDKLGQTALHLAALVGNDYMVRALIDCGADKTIRNKNGKTALEAIQSLIGYANSTRHLACAEILTGTSAPATANKDFKDLILSNKITRN